MAAYDSTVVAAIVLCGAMSTTRGKRKQRGVTPADIQATKETVHRLVGDRIESGKISVSQALRQYNVSPRTPPAKRVKTKDPQEENRKRGKGSGTGGGKVKSAGSTDVVVLSDGEGSKSKIRGRGEAPEVQHEPAVAKAPRMLTRSKPKPKPKPKAPLNQEKQRDNDTNVSLQSSDDGCGEHRSCDGGEKPVRSTKGQRFQAEASRDSTVVERTKAKEDSSSSEESIESVSVESRRAKRTQRTRGCEESSKSAVVEGSGDDYTSYSSYESDSDETPQHRHHPAVAEKALRVPQPLQPLPPPPEDPPPTSYRPTVGQVSHIHLHVEAGADIVALAADTRNRAAIVLLAVCADVAQAKTLGTALNQASFGNPTRGNGETGRSPPSEYQEKYLYAVHGRIVIAGRYGIVKEIHHHLAMDCPQGGTMLIAQLDFVVGIEGSLHMRVAAIAADSTVVERPEVLTAWNATVQELLDASVRVLVFKDSAEQFLEALRQRMQSTQISNVCGRGPSFFVLGPVDGVWAKESTKLKNMFTIYAAEDGVDMTSKWSSFGLMKLKDSRYKIEKTTCTFVFVGSETSRRSPATFLKRKLGRKSGKGGGKGGGRK